MAAVRENHMTDRTNKAGLDGKRGGESHHKKIGADGKGSERYPSVRRAVRRASETG